MRALHYFLFTLIIIVQCTSFILYSLIISISSLARVIATLEFLDDFRTPKKVDRGWNILLLEITVIILLEFSCFFLQMIAEYTLVHARGENLFAMKICPAIAVETYFTTRLSHTINHPNVPPPYFFYFSHNSEEALSTLSASGFIIYHVYAPASDSHSVPHNNFIHF